VIAYLRGRVASVGEDQCVIDVGGVGYAVHASARTLRRLPADRGTAELLIETQLREDAILLYGFADDAERSWFRLLQSVQGVGARVALSLLGALSPDELASAVMAQDRAALTRASGVGSRLAGRILSELKERVGTLPSALPVPSAAGARPTSGDEDALSALVNLGYGRAEAFTALARVRARAPDETRIDVLIRESLKELAR
jgi:Holliday junction DNA helicase RuvA